MKHNEQNKHATSKSNQNKIEKMKNEYIDFIKRVGWDMYNLHPKEEQIRLDDLFHKWHNECSPISFLSFEKTYPLCLKKWFLGRHLFEGGKYSFKKWALELKGCNIEIKEEDLGFNFFDIVSKASEIVSEEPEYDINIFEESLEKNNTCH